MPRKAAKPIDRLMAAMDRCAKARGEAQWTNGYRAAAGHDEEVRLHGKELRQWGRCHDAEAAFRRLALRLLKEAADA